MSDDPSKTAGIQRHGTRYLVRPTLAHHDALRLVRLCARTGESAGHAASRLLVEALRARPETGDDDG